MCVLWFIMNRGGQTRWDVQRSTFTLLTGH